jgi:hypothetical protein
MALRALIPAGYMLAPAHDGSSFVAVTLCSGHGPVEALIDLRTGEVRDPASDTTDPDRRTNQSGADALCVFAAVAPLAAPERAPIVAQLVIPEIAAAAPAAELRPGQGLAAPPPWATGPPFLG